MNLKSLASGYSALTPKERFQLIFAAGARGDESEQKRLMCSGRKVCLSVSDHAPWARAFNELATIMFLELLEETAKHRLALQRWTDEEDFSGIEEDDGDEDLEVIEESSGAEATSKDEDADDDESPSDRWLHFYLAQGYILRAKLAGWQLFCERLSVPPFAVWQLLPGYERIQIAMKLVEDNEFRVAPVFKDEGMLAWLKRIRPPDEPEPTAQDLIRPESIADRLDEALHDQASWWGA